MGGGGKSNTSLIKLSLKKMAWNNDSKSQKKTISPVKMILPLEKTVVILKSLFMIGSELLMIG